MTRRTVLVINCGSSSIKFALRREGDGQAILSGLAERLGGEQATLAWEAGDQREQIQLGDGSHSAAMAALLPLIEQHADQPLSAVGHRVVHGGEHFTRAQRIDDSVIAAITANAALAPLHNPANLTGIHAAMDVCRLHI